jgi:hypothetical protein
MVITHLPLQSGKAGRRWRRVGSGEPGPAVRAVPFVILIGGCGEKMNSFLSFGSEFLFFYNFFKQMSKMGRPAPARGCLAALVLSMVQGPAAREKPSKKILTSCFGRYCGIINRISDQPQDAGPLRPKSRESLEKQARKLHVFELVQAAAKRPAADTSLTVKTF